jgi:glycogen operon protein
MNMHWENSWFELPGLPDGKQWHVVANTGMPTPEDIWETGQEPLLEEQSGLFVGNRAVAILIGK